MRDLGKFWLAGFCAVLITAMLSAPARAQVKPGDFITDENVSKVRDLITPGQYMRVMHGMSIKIAPTERVDWPPR